MVQTRDFQHDSYDLNPPPSAVQMGLGEMVNSWADAGSALPVAVVMSIFDDVLGAHPGEDFLTRPRPLTLNDILLDEYGQAHLVSPGTLSYREISRLLRELLVGGFGDGGIPPAAQTLLSQLGTDADRPEVVDSDRLRHRMRTIFGAPASRDEVGSCVLGLASTQAEPSVSSDWSDKDVVTVQVKTERPFAMSSIEEDVNLESLAATRESSAQFVREESPTEDLVGLCTAASNDALATTSAADGSFDVSFSSVHAELEGVTDSESAQALQEREDTARPQREEPEEVDSRAYSDSGIPVQDLKSPGISADQALDAHPDLESLDIPELVVDEPDSDEICVTNYPEPDYYLDQDEADNCKPPSLLPRVRGGIFSRPTWRKLTRAKSDPESPSQIPRVRIVPGRRRPLTLPAAPPARLRTTSTGPADSMISLPKKDSPALWVGLICACLVVGALIYSMAVT